MTRRCYTEYIGSYYICLPDVSRTDRIKMRENFYRSHNNIRRFVLSENCRYDHGSPSTEALDDTPVLTSDTNSLEFMNQSSAPRIIDHVNDYLCLHESVSDI